MARIHSSFIPRPGGTLPSTDVVPVSNPAFNPAAYQPENEGRQKAKAAATSKAKAKPKPAAPRAEDS
jgi:hypothetical protein